MIYYLVGYFFSGVITPIIIFLKIILGVEIQTGIEILNEVTQIFSNVSPKIKMNNNCTMIYAFLRDLGFAGLILYPSIIALFFSSVYKKNEEG